MSTVPNSGTPAPANNAKTLTISDSMSGNYGRPASGGPPVPGKQEGIAPTSGAGPGPTPAYQISMAGAAPTNGGSDMGHGATQIVAQPDATGHPSGDASGGGTVGDSGPQGAAPASTDMDYASDIANPGAG